MAKTIDFSLGRWKALTRCLDDSRLAANNNCFENLNRPIALGRNNWLIAGGLRVVQRGRGHKLEPLGSREKA